MSGRKRRARSGASRRARRRGSDPIVEEFEIVGHLDSHAVEALQLEIRRLAGILGLDIKDVRIARGERRRSE